MNQRLSIYPALLSLTLMVVTTAASAQANTTLDSSNQTPLISRVVGSLGDQPVFEKVAHPAPGIGEKVVVVALPRTAKGKFSLRKFQVVLKFETLRTMDACNTSTINGAVLSQVPVSSNLKALRLEVPRNSRATSLMACTNTKHASRPVAIPTYWLEPEPFTDNLVVYVPKEVTVTAKIWSTVSEVQAVEPQNLTEDFEPSELDN